MRIVIAAGGTGGHIFPALSVALEMRKQCDDLSLLWIGTSRNREKELCAKNDIPITVLDVRGIKRKISFSSMLALTDFAAALITMNSMFRKKRPDAVAAFGGYVCAPVLAAARLNNIPYYLQEQNSVPGLVNRIFASKAECTFLGYPLSAQFQLKGRTTITKTPIRTSENSLDTFDYPQQFDKTKVTVFICGGSQGAASMNDCLIEPMQKMVANGTQLLWQSGSYSFEKIAGIFKKHDNAFIFETIDDMYPYYAASNIIICRSGASTLNEIAYFGLPCITIPLPWAAENHQWMNAGHIEQAGWGVRVAQNENCSAEVEEALKTFLEDKEYYENMRQKALDNSPEGANTLIAEEILGHIQSKRSTQ